MEIKEAVALIKQEFNMRVVDRNVREAIDTVVAELERPLPTNEQIEANGIEGGLRDGELQMFYEGAIWMRDKSSQVANDNNVTSKTYAAEDMEAFAEWVDINGYKQILKGVWNRDISYQQKMTTTQLRETWEEWKNE